MKLKMHEIVIAYDAIRRHANRPFPPLIAYRIQKNIRALEPDASAYEKARQELIRDKYGVKSSDVNGGERYDVPPEKFEEFTGELKPLQDQELEIPILTIPLEAIVQITPVELMALEWMFETGEKPDETPRAKSRKRSK